MSIEGIDISYAQPRVDFHKVYESGVRFVYFKVNEGDTIDHTTTRERVRAAKNAGLLVGGYNYVHPRATRRGSTEYNIFFKRAKEVGLLDKGCLRPMIDFEVTHTTNYITKQYVSSWIKRCVKISRIHPVIYTGSYFWEGFGFKTNFNSPLWIAAYGSKPRIPAQWKVLSFHQYSGNGHVAGVAGDVDRDRYLGHDRAQLVRNHTFKTNGY